MSINELNNFDKLLKSKLDQHTVPFDEGNWSSLEKNLPKKTIKPFYKNPWLWSGAAVIAVVISSLTLLNSTESNSNENKVASNDMEVTKPLNNEDIQKKTEQEINQPNHSNENINAVTNVTNVNEENNNTSEKVDHSKEDVHIKKTETIASNNNKTEVNNNTATYSVDTSLSPTVTPEDFTLISEVKKPDAQIFCKVKEQCAGSIFVFETTSQKDVDYLWSFGDEKFSKEQNPTHKFETAGSYKVGLIVRSKIDNSALTKAKEILIHVIELPNVSFETEETVNMGIPVLSFINTTDKANKWSWNLGDGNISSDKDPYHNYKRKGYYNVSLTATNKEGCISTKSKKVHIENDYNLLAPNSFTPNGDGINDFFIPEALKVMDIEFSMSVYSQADGLLFETKSVNSPWNGMNNQTGDKCKEGNYIWVVTLTNNKGQTEQYKGAVLILE